MPNDSESPISIDVELAIGRMERAVRSLIQRAVSVPTEALYLSTAPDDWTPMRVLAHLAEILPYWTGQVQDVIARDGNGLPFGRTHADPERIGAVERHANDPLGEVVPRIEAGLEETATVLRSLAAADWLRTARHANRGELTVAQFVEQFLLEHAEEHAAQAERTLSTLGYPVVG